MNGQWRATTPEVEGLYLYRRAGGAEPEGLLRLRYYEDRQMGIPHMLEAIPVFPSAMNQAGYKVMPASDLPGEWMMIASSACQPPR